MFDPNCPRCEGTGTWYQDHYSRSAISGVWVTSRTAASCHCGDSDPTGTVKAMNRLLDAMQENHEREVMEEVRKDAGAMLQHLNDENLA